MKTNTFFSLVFGAGLALSGYSGALVAATSYSVLNSTSDNLTVSGYSNTGTNGALAGKSLTWYTGGYGISSTSSETNNQPQHAVDNNGYQEAMLLNFGASTQLKSVQANYISGDADITVLAWKPSEYMNPSGPSVAAPVLAGNKYSDLIALGWSLVGNYQGLVQGAAKAVNVTNPVSSSYWLVMTYNSLIGVGAAASSDASARGFVADTSADYAKFYKVSYAEGTHTESRVSEPSTALMLGSVLLGLMGWRARKQKA